MSFLAFAIIVSIMMLVVGVSLLFFYFIEKGR